MRWVGRQAQLVEPLPTANAHIGRIELGALLGQLPASFFCALKFFAREAIIGGLDEVDCHRSLEHTRQTRPKVGVSTGYTRF